MGSQMKLLNGTRFFGQKARLVNGDAKPLVLCLW